MSPEKRAHAERALAFMESQTAPVCRDDHALMIEIQAEAERLGLVLVTDGRELAYTLPHHIPPGWTRFALVDKNARRLDPKTPRA